MSEINSIANGTFTIGSTSAINFQAGPGITVTEPSAGTVRIGNDETVLWSGSPTSAITASESFKNFEKVDIYISMTNNPDLIVTYDFNVMPTTGYFNICRPRGTMNLNVAYLHFDATETTITETMSKMVSFGAYTTTANAVTCTLNAAEDRNVIRKVIGINRISGGNA